MNTTEPTARPKRSIGTLIWLIISQLMAVGTLWFWVIAAGMSLMSFDEGSSREAWTFVIAVWAYPIVPLVLAIGAWIAFAFRKNRLAAVLSGLTFTPPVVLALYMWIETQIWHMSR